MIHVTDDIKSIFRILIAIAIVLCSSVSINAQTRDISFNNSSPKEGLTIEQNTRIGLSMRNTIKRLSLVNITENGYTGDVIQGGSGISLPANEGEPNIPSISRFVAIPNGATARIEMGYRSMTTLQNIDLLPAAPIKFDTDDSPNTYEKNPIIYNRNAFYPEHPVSVSQPFSLRGVQTVAVTVMPYQYNPVTKELRVYDDLQFNIRFDGGNGEFGDTRLRSPYWDPILMQNLANYNQLPVIDYEARMQEWVNHRSTGCEYLIVIPNNEDFRQYANQLRDYRIQQGILTEVKSLSEMGCTTTDLMKSYFHNAYNAWDIPPVAVLLLGDHNNNMAAGIPAETTYHSTNYGNCITDNGYADVTGDLLPEMAFSRLVAANANEAQMMVNKQIEYEYSNPNTNPTTYDQPITALGWQTQRWFQLCSETVGGYWRNQGKHPVRINAIYSGTPDRSWSTNQHSYMVVSYFGPEGLGYIPAQPSELGGWTGGTAAQVVDAVNNGCMLLQHRDHGYYQGWGEPDFSTSDVAQMNNTGKMTFVNTINCQTGAFDHSSDCLIEAFMRHTSNGQNAGAVGCIGPTQSSYSFVNDTYVWGLYDQYDPQFLPDYGPYANYEGNWRPAFGNVAGKYFLQQSSWPSNPENKAITHKMFTAHCDAFLTLYTQVPTAMNVTHPSQITSTTTGIDVVAPQGATIALTRNNAILAVATATGTSQNIAFPAQPDETDITIAVTKQDRLRYVDSIHVIPMPNLTLTNVTIDDYNVETGNGNGRLDPGEAAEITFNFINNGDAAANNLAATLSTFLQHYITINTSNVSTLIVTPGQTVEITYTVSISARMPKGQLAVFSLSVVADNYSFNHSFGQRVGLEIANFENGLEGFEWNNDSQHPWKVSNADPFASAFCLQSGTIGHNANSTLSILYNVENETDEIRFARKTDCEAHGDFLRFYIDGILQQEWTGSLSWQEVVFPVTQGEHIFSWAYEKNGYGTNGQDRVWIDEILFPVRHTTFACNAGASVNLCQEAVQLDASAIGYESLLWTSNGDGSFSAADILSPVYTPGDQDLVNKTVTLTLHATNNGGETIGDNVVVHFHEAASIVLDEENDVCENGIILLNATVEEANRVVWNTTGDGSFSHPESIETAYTPGEQDIANGSVSLKLKALSPYDCGNAESNLLLHIHPVEHTDFNMEACGSYNWNGIDYYDDGNYEQSLLNQNGCDSIVTMHLNFVDAYETENVAISCDSYEWNGETYTTSGDYSHVFTSQHGCDSTVVLHLTLSESNLVEFDANACDSYIWNDTEYTESGDYTNTFINASGCDSIITMHLTINHAPEDIQIEGSSEVDILNNASNTFSIEAIPNTVYSWEMEPVEAGTLSQEDSIALIVWDDYFKGEVQIKVTASNECGETQGTHTITVKNSSNLDEQHIKANIFPNPTNGNLTIEAKGLKQITVYNTTGQIVFNKEARGNETHVNINHLAPGIYIICIQTQNGNAQKRVSVVK